MNLLAKPGAMMLVVALNVLESRASQSNIYICYVNEFDAKTKLQCNEWKKKSSQIVKLLIVNGDFLHINEYHGFVTILLRFSHKYISDIKSVTTV